MGIPVSPINGKVAGAEDKVKVAIAVGSKKDTNWFGHVAIAIEGQGVTSFGTATEPRSSFTDYLNDQSVITRGILRAKFKSRGLCKIKS